MVNQSDLNKTEQLHDQIKRLVRSERKLYELTADFDQQISRMGLLNEFALSTNSLESYDQILSDSLHFLTLNYVIDYGVGVVLDLSSNKALYKASINKGNPVEGIDKVCVQCELLDIELESSVNVIVLDSPKQMGEDQKTARILQHCFRNFFGKELVFEKDARFLIFSSFYSEINSRVVLIVYCPSPDKLAYLEKTPSKNDITFLTLINDHLQHAIENTISHERLRKFADDLEVVVGERTRELYLSREKYRVMFDSSPISLIEIDLSLAKQYLDELKKKQIKNIDVFFEKYPEKMIECIQKMKILNVNKTTLSLFNVLGYDHFMTVSHSLMSQGSWESNKKIIIDLLWYGRAYVRTEGEYYTYDNRKMYLDVSVSVEPGYEKSYEHLLIAIADITALKKAEERITYVAEHDVLTGLANRAVFDVFLNAAMHRAVRTKKKMALIYFDLDYFKSVNDMLGHNIGDILLKDIGQRIKNLIREDDLVARLGGDEFAIILNDIPHTKQVLKVAQKIQTVVKQPIKIMDHEINISASIGIVLYPSDGTGRDSQTLIKDADIAMYTAKMNGRDNIQFFTVDMEHRYRKSVEFEKAVQDSYKKNELFLVYQPIIRLLDREQKKIEIVGIEALLRWKTAEGKIVPPNEFLPVLEKSKMIVQVGDWVLSEAFQQLRKWLSMENIFSDLFKMTVNVSYLQLIDDKFSGTLFDDLKRHNLSAQNVAIEITESSMMENPIKTAKIVSEIGEKGIKFFIDDFGSGYSSLAYLGRLPIDALKIGSFFIANIKSNLGNPVIVNAIINLAKNLNMDVIAEGVETEEQMDFLMNARCDLMQGYYFGPPMDAAAMTNYLVDHGVISR